MAMKVQKLDSYELVVVLVRSIYERNIGATSRAMSNMGVKKLILIAPQCEITYTAQQAAATGQEALQNRLTYPSWEEFKQNEATGILLAFSARDGRGRKTSDLNETLDLLIQNSPLLKETKPIIYLVFGPEDWGLSAEDLGHCHQCVCLPTYGENSSLNLAQAVLLAMYSLRQKWGGGKRTTLDGSVRSRDQKSDVTNLVFPENSLRTWLEEMGFDLSKKKINAFTTMRRILLQNTPTPKELNMLEIVLQQSIRKLRQLNKLNK
jgi:tRNA/rRNA methyltransferase